MLAKQGFLKGFRRQMCQRVSTLEISLLRSAVGAGNISYHSLSLAVWRIEGILELLSSGTHGPGRNSVLCCVLAAAVPRVSVDPAQTPALPPGGLSSSKTSGFPAHLGSGLLGRVSNSAIPATAPMGCGGKVGKSSPHQGHNLGLLAHPQRRQHRELWMFPAAEGIQPRSPDLTSSQETGGFQHVQWK